MSSDSNYYKEILDKLEKLVKKEHAIISLTGILNVLIAGIAVWGLFCFAEMLFHFTSIVRTIIIALFIAALAAVIIVQFLFPLLKYLNVIGKTDFNNAANKVGKNFPSIKDDLLNAMQLVADDGWKKLYSGNLIDAAFKNIYAKTKEIKFDSIVSFKKVKELAYYFGGVFVFVFLLLFFIPGLKASSLRLINFQKEFIPPPKFIIYVKPGNTQITKGEDLKISVRVEGQSYLTDKQVPKEIYLVIKNSDETNFEMQKLSSNSGGNFYYEIPAVRGTFKYYASAENVNSNIYEVSVIDRPVIKTLNEVIAPPAYSRQQQVQQKDNGNISALAGSVVDLNISATKRLAKAWIEFDDSTKKDLKINSYDAEGKFVVKKDENYKIIIVDEAENQNLSPINYSIKALQDEYPLISIVYPNQNTLLGTDNRQPLDIKISDDYGFTKLNLNYRLSQSKYETEQKDFSALEIPINKSAAQQEVQYVWNLTSLNLTAEDVVTYYLEVFDNDAVSGPKSAKSSSFTIRIPSLEEVLNSTDNSQSKGIQDLEETLKKAEDLKQKLTDINNELKQKDKDISWQEKQKIEQAANQFKELQQKVSDISKNMQKMQNDLQKNNLLSKETLDKYQELQKLFDEMSTDEMKKAMEQMQNVLQQMDRKMTQNALQNFQVNEDQLKQSIERTMNLLKRIQIEQKIDEMLKRTDDIVKNQDEIKNQTNSKDAARQKDALNKKQDDVTNKLQDFSKGLEDLSKKLAELKDMPKDQLEKLQKQFKDQQNQKLSQQASQNIEQNQMQQAEQDQTQISQNMQEMKKGMEQFQKSVAGQSQMQAFKDMMRLTDNLITLSKQQEQLKDQMNNNDESSSSLNQKAQQQNDIQKNLEKIMNQLSALSQKTFAVTPEMGKALGDADRKMNESMQNLQDRNASMAALSQSQAMANVNEAASLLKSSMEQMMKGNGGQGGGMPSLMQQLQQLSGQQMNLNNLTQMMQQMMKGNLSPQQQAQMQRLAQQQDMIRKSLEQLNKEAVQSGESKKIPANLEDIAKNMQEVVKNMNSDNVDQKVLQQQEHILSRLLDAQRSVNQRDYENQRESKSGKEFVHQSPADLNLSSDNGKNNLRDELNNAVQEGYSKDYEDLIRKYFEALQKENVKNN